MIGYETITFSYDPDGQSFFRLLLRRGLRISLE